MYAILLQELIELKNEIFSLSVSVISVKMM